MGSSRYSDAEYTIRSTDRLKKGIPTFDYDDKIKTGKAVAMVHDSLNPKGVDRESRDSAGQLKLPIGVILDTTGSMQKVPAIIQSKLPALMGGFLNDKASGKKYLGDNVYPDILVGAVDDYNAQAHYSDHSGTLQLGQFESGLEIDDNITNLWMTGNGGGTYEEEYNLAVYFFARHTKSDHWDKRKKKGYLFIIGDEHCYPTVKKAAILNVLGETVQADISTEAIFKECKKRYNIFYILPDMTSHYDDDSLFKYWQDLLGQQNTIRLSDPNLVCETIVGAVAICEGHASHTDLVTDGLGDAVSSALATLEKGKNSVAPSILDSLPATSGGGVERL